MVSSMSSASPAVESMASMLHSHLSVLRASAWVRKGYLSLVTAPGWATVPRPGWSSYGRYAILMVGAPSTLKMQIAAGPLSQFRDFDSYPVQLSKIRSGHHQADWLQQGECLSSPRLRNRYGLPQRSHMSKDIRVPFVQPSDLK